MGTRSITVVHEYSRKEKGHVILNMYRQWDGYPSGHGMELATFLNSRKMVDGYSDDKAQEFNGMGCMAAQMIAYFKKSVGGFYIIATDDRNCGQEYEYHIYEDGIIVTDSVDELFNGTWKQFKKWCRESNA